MADATDITDPSPHPKSRGAARRALRRGPTIDDVAEVAGVSRGTVSRVLNGAHYVSPGALKAVEQAMRTTGYTVNQSARSLVTKQSNAIAFVLSEPQERLFEDPNFSVLLRCCTQALGEQDFSLVLMLESSADERDRVLRYVRGGHVDGVLLISAHAGDPFIGDLARGVLPAVACGRPAGHGVSIPYVAAEDRQGAREMTQYLVDQGRRRIGMIACPQVVGGPERLAGYRDVLGRKALKRLVVDADDYSHAAGVAAMRSLLATSPDIDAVFAASDMLAAGAIDELRRAGRRVPEDVAVGGFDDSRIARETDPPLTTIRQPLEQVAREMVDVLLRLVRREPASSRLLPTELVVRESA
ncbi:LacI family transcriptional regulator [Asanoa ishikariensis]|uniref:Transcriptional regulator, LacI family n=1 Tax=Asanoa ishikariensis TaxID=137265 RepID=A0A1H3URE8_9ACTN|nr:LacI family DNA-binding transcriptional regulator [Asanoa ishikariensis]GIF69160.1 LacI family transcriptional regulator [Asanoa ishikariensis]SDZ64339.1 transcriptional regulator, LacI family [Asanoa ishikariensis]